MKVKTLRLPQSFQLFGQLWEKLFNPSSCVPDVQLDDVLTRMVSIAAETILDDMPLIEKWALSYVAIVNASGNDVVHLWLTSSWMNIAVPHIPPYVTDKNGSYIMNKKGGYKYRSRRILAAESKKEDQDKSKAMSKMEKTIKKLLRSKQLILVDDKLRLPS